MRIAKQFFMLLSAILLTLNTFAQNNQKSKTRFINTDKEPKIKSRKFKSLFDGKTLNGWSTKQGTMKFEVINGEIVGTCSKGPSTFLCTDKEYKDFIFTCEVKWEVDGNTGVQIRSRIRKDDNVDKVIGPQAEMEDLGKKGRGWSGGIYGQNCGGWFYPLKAPEHAPLKNAIDRSDWNRLTIKVEGNVFKTWINGLPAAHWVDIKNEFPNGFIGLQVHGGKKGIIHWKNLKIRQL